MQSLETEVLIIGSGLAGLRAAIESARNGALTTVLCKSPMGLGSNSALAGGGLRSAITEEGIEDHIQETLQAGKNLNDHRLVKELAYGGIKEIQFLKSIGAELVLKPPFGYWVNRTGYPETMVGGRILVRKLLEEASRQEKIRFLPGFFVYKILLDEDHLRGVIGFNKEGELCQISCRAMILATGGAGGIYKRNDNDKRILGDGYALALEVGLPLIDMEFVQFFPFGFAEPGLPKTIIYPPYPEEARIIDAEGNDFLKKQGLDMSLDKIIVDLRDRMASLIYKEDEKDGVFMDYTQIPDSRFEKFPLSLFPKKRFNFKGKPFRISPLAHFSMGGIKIGPSGETHIQGLLAVGEVAGGVHGANRMGGNALTECLVFGAKSGHLAAEFAKSHHLKKGFNIPEDWPKILSVRMNGLRAPSKFFALRRAVRNLAWKSAGPLRNEKLMREGLSSIDALTQEQKALEVCSVKDLISKRELENSLSVLKAILLSSLTRKESRGAFQREDFPQEGGAEFLKRVSVKMKKAEKDIEVSWEDSDS